MRNYLIIQELAEFGAPLFVLFGERKQGLGLEIVH